MKITLSQTEKLLKGNQSFSQLGFSLMVTRLRSLYTEDPASIQHCMSEINTFLDKFKGIMNADYAIIEKL